MRERAAAGSARRWPIEVGPFGVDVVVFQPGNHGTDLGSNVVPVLVEDTAYRRPPRPPSPGRPRLGRFARLPQKAVARICDVLEVDRAPFRVRLATDDHVAHLIARIALYAVRRRGVESTTGIRP